MTQKIAILGGGYSSEWEISRKSAEVVYQHLDREKYEPYLVMVRKDEWYVLDGDQKKVLDLNYFGFLKNGKKIRFDIAFNAIHGDPGENGKLQGYMESKGIFHTSCSQSVSALTFNKWQCNTVLQKLGFTCAKSILLDENDKVNPKHIVSELGLPLFVKPNNAGSSFGVSKVKKITELETAIKTAFSEGSDIIMESFMDGTEVGCGVFRYKGEVTALTPTEIRSENEFFDYEAKYQGKAQEITPAEISKKMIQLIKNISTSVYQKIHARGIIRVDFIIVNDIPHIIEINSIPGLTAESIVPQQVRYDGIKLSTFFGMLLEEASH
ncbi:MAG TPA: D-alanine--D-alanine ligase [Flavobacteriales bacterium]|nr:D-alanine--D-alanine ligase [Flavobacteriales bacterium]